MGGIKKTIKKVTGGTLINALFDPGRLFYNTKEDEAAKQAADQALNLELQGVKVFGVELQRLISLTEEPSVRMPSGLTREQRRLHLVRAVSA